MRDDPSELEREDTWDDDKAELQRPTPNPRMVVSVAFRRMDYELVAAGAERDGKRASQYIREAAIDRAVLTTGFQRLGYSYALTDVGALYMYDEPFIPPTAGNAPILFAGHTAPEEENEETGAQISLSA